MTATPLPDGRLAFSAASVPLEQTAPLVFEGPNDLRTTFQRRTRDGTMTVRVNAMPLAMEWERVPFYLDRRFVIPLMAVSLTVTMLSIALWPLAAFLRRRRRRAFGATAQDRRQHVWVRVVLILNLLVTAALVAGLAWLETDATRFNRTLDPWLLGMYAAAWLSVAGAPRVVWITVRFWRDGVGSRWARVHQTLLAAAVVVFVWFCLTWRLAGTTLNY